MPPLLLSTGFIPVAIMRRDRLAVVSSVVATVGGRRHVALLERGPALPDEVVIGIDDTIERRWGARIKARGIYRDFLAGLGIPQEHRLKCPNARHQQIAI